MRKLAGVIFFLIGLYFCLSFSHQWLENRTETEAALEEAKKVVGNDLPAKLENGTENTEFTPEPNDVIGILTIPKIDKSLSVVEGTEEEMLARGVGHYSSTVFPGDGEQILLSGHRDTAFRHFGELEIGDRFIVEMPYGTFEYEMRSAEIVDADDRSVIMPKGEEVLTLSTCYPFSYIGNAPDRYIIYAYPVK